MKYQDSIFLIQEKFETLTKNQKKIARFILENYKEIPFMSAIELGKVVGVSDASVIRFSKHIGFDGFSDLKKGIRYHLNQSGGTYQRLTRSKGLQISDHSKDEMRKADLNNLEQFLGRVNEERMDAFVNEIYTAKKIYVVGIGLDQMLTILLTTYLRKMGFDTLEITVGGFALLDALNAVTHEDLVILFSFPRHTKDEQHAAQMAKKKGARLVVVSDSNYFNIMNFSDLSILVNIENGTFLNSYIVPTFFVNHLILAVFEQDKQRIMEKLKVNNEHIGEFDIYSD